MPREWIDWKQVGFEAPASSSETAVLALAGSLFGQPMNRPLSWLPDLGERNSALPRGRCATPAPGLARGWPGDQACLSWSWCQCGTCSPEGIQPPGRLLPSGCLM